MSAGYAVAVDLVAKNNKEVLKAIVQYGSEMGFVYWGLNSSGIGQTGITQDEALHYLLNQEEYPSIYVSYKDTGFTIIFSTTNGNLSIILDEGASVWKKDFLSIYMEDNGRHALALLDLSNQFVITYFSIFSDLESVIGENTSDFIVLTISRSAEHCQLEAKLVQAAACKHNYLFANDKMDTILEPSIISKLLEEVFANNANSSFIIQAEGYAMQFAFCNNIITARPLLPYKVSINNNSYIDLSFYVKIVLNIFEDFGLFEMTTNVSSLYDIATE